MSGSFTAKQIEVEFNIVNTGQTLTISGHRVSCQMASAGLETGVLCDLRIDGMNLSDMNLLSTIQAGIVSQSLNFVTVKAGSYGEAPATFFQGGIMEAFVDYAGAPSTAFVVSALSMSIPAAQPISPTSYPNGVAVADAMRAIAAKAGLAVQNYGVTSYLPGGLYFWGSAADQIEAVAAASKVSYNVALNTLSIWPPGVQASTANQIEVSSATGLIGYPAYSQYGVDLRMLFNPNIGFRTTVKLDSQYAPAAWVNAQGQITSLTGQSVYPASDGTWVAMKVEHDLQSETPNGTWETHVTAARPDFAGSIAFAN